ncbi:MAG: hypothetical protein ACYTG2_10955 [Planctomycetota bacterium]|jgi:hypothetical protein
MNALEQLLRIHHRFGRRAAAAKLGLLEQIAAAPRLGVRDLARLQDAVEFLRAHPDGPALRRALTALQSRLPGTDVVHEFSYAVVRRLLAVKGVSLEIAWDDLDEGTLVGVLDLLLPAAESDGLNDARVSLRDWWGAARPGGMGDLAWLVGLLERSGLPDHVRVQLYESCAIPVRYRGPRRADLGLPVRRVHYQRRALSTARFPLRPFIASRPGRARRGGPRVVDLCLQALCTRSLEIHALIHASDDALIVDGQDGLTIVLISAAPAARSPLETLFVYLLFKNGVPMAYGPLGVFGGCCEMGMNVFPEFRGAEVRRWYGELMREAHHRLGVELFLLTRYAMGEDNDEALESGAFWFYRKLGFRPVEPEVEHLAREEEARRRRDPRHRSDRRTLLRLSASEAVLDLSGGRCKPLDHFRLSAAATRGLTAAAGGDFRTAEARAAGRVGRLLGVDPRARAVRHAAPILDLIPDVPDWTAAERKSLGRLLDAKDRPSERRAAQLSARNARLLEALRAIAAG